MRRILAEVAKCVRLLAEIKGVLAGLATTADLSEIRASLQRIEAGLAELNDGPAESTVELNYRVSEQTNL